MMISLMLPIEMLMIKMNHKTKGTPVNYHIWDFFQSNVMMMIKMMSIAMLMNEMLSKSTMMMMMMMMRAAAGCTAFLPWAAFVKCHRGAKFTFTNDSTPATVHYIIFLYIT